jgi:hypothetical protein
MTLANGIILGCIIACIGTVALVSFALWIRSNDVNADRPERDLTKHAE